MQKDIGKWNIEDIENTNVDDTIIDASNIIDENIVSKKIDGIELYIEETIQNEIDIEFNKLRSVNTYNESGISIRTIDDAYLGFSFSTELSKNSIDRLLNQAILSGKINGRIVNYNFANNVNDRHSIKDIYDENIRDLDEDDLLQIEDIIIDIRDKKKINIDKFTLNTKLRNKRLCNSNNLDYSYNETIVEVGLMASYSNISKNRMFVYRKFDLEQIKKDIEVAVDMLNKKLPRKKIVQKRYKIIFDPYSFAIVLSCLLPTAISADSLYKKDTYLKLDERITSNNIKLINDSTLEGGILSSPIDGEGFPTKRTTIIDKGIFVKPICNNYWSIMGNFKNTSNSVKINFRSPPTLNITNVIFDLEDQNKKTSIDAILEDGIYVSNLFPDPSKFNMKTGEFLFNIMESYYVKNGEIKFFVEPFLLFGNIIDLYNNINLYSKESYSNVGIICPYIVADMTVTPMPEISKREIIAIMLKRFYRKIFD